MYTIACSYTGYFDMPFPFEFQSLAECTAACDALNELRETLPSWGKLKPFRVCRKGENGFLDSIEGEWIEADESQAMSRASELD